MDGRSFLGLPEQEMCEEFCDNCIFLEHCVDIALKYHLCRLHNFCVELTSEERTGIQNSLTAFVDGPRLDKYMRGNLFFIRKTLDTDFR